MFLSIFHHSLSGLRNCLCQRINLIKGHMDPNFKAEFERQQRKMLEKMSTILNKLESMKHQLEDVSTKAYVSQK